MEFVIRVSGSQVSAPPLGTVEHFKGLMNRRSDESLQGSLSGTDARRGLDRLVGFK